MREKVAVILNYLYDLCSVFFFYEVADKFTA